MKKLGIIAVMLLLIIIVLVMYGCNDANKLSFSQESYFLEPDQSFTPPIKNYSKKKEYTLLSSNPTIAKIDGKNVKGLREGVVTLTVLSGDNSASTKLYILKEEEYSGSIPEPAPEYVRISFIIEDYVFTSPMEIQKGLVPGKPYDIQRGGYSLDGWYSDKDCTIKYNFDQPVNQNIAVYGKWVINQAQYIFERLPNNTSYVKRLAFPNVPYTELTLPTTANDNTPVVGIYDSAFKDKITITKVSIPDEYTYIGEQAFSGCSSLEEVIFGQQSQLIEIENNAFYLCSELKTFFIPSAVTEIGGFAFAKCLKLDIPELPQGLKTLEQYVFSETAITSVNLENVTKIYEGAFNKCVSLLTVTNTHNVEKCYKLAFQDTGIYKKQLFENKIAYINTILVGANETTSFVLNPNVTLIADYALDNAKFSSLIMTIHSSLPIVGAQAFHQDIAIIVHQLYFNDARIYEPWSIYKKQLYIEFQESGFTLLRRMELEQDKYTIRKYLGTAIHLDTNILPYEIENIRAGAFSNNNATEETKIQIKTLTLGNVAKISDYAISNIETLLAIIMNGDKIPTLTSNMSIQRSSLAGGALKIYTPAALYTDYQDKWTNLKNIIYNINIVKDGLAVSVVSGSSTNYVIQYFGDESTIIIPDLLESSPITNISDNAFRYNKAVEHLVIGSNITKIGYASITNTNIKVLEFTSVQPPETDASFLHINTGLETIYVPAGTLEAYKQALPKALNGFIQEAEE